MKNKLPALALCFSIVSSAATADQSDDSSYAPPFNIDTFTDKDDFTCESSVSPLAVSHTRKHGQNAQIRIISCEDKQVIITDCHGLTILRELNEASMETPSASNEKQFFRDLFESEVKYTLNAACLKL